MRCKCGHPMDEHGPSGCAADDEAAMGGCLCAVTPSPEDELLQRAWRLVHAQGRMLERWGENGNDRTHLWRELHEAGDTLRDFLEGRIPGRCHGCGKQMDEALWAQAPATVGKLWQRDCPDCANVSICGTCDERFPA